MEGFVVHADGVSRRFGAKLALDEVTFRAREGLVHGVVGANGAGKTTLVRLLLGLLRPSRGTIRVFGRDPIRSPVSVLQRIGYLSEERALPEWMRVDELMAYTQAYYPRWDARYAQELVDTFGLDPTLPVRALSRGMRAQVGLVVSVAHRPELLVLDEPSAGLDPVVRQDILNAIVRAVADDGRTVIFSSHLLDEVERMSDHVTMIHQGRVALDGSLEEVRGGHRRSVLRFAEPLDRAPRLEAVLALEGHGRSWTVLHNEAEERFREAVAVCGGEVLQSRDATLEEIFVARVGRPSSAVEAA